jgi:hypothetical protein
MNRPTGICIAVLTASMILCGLPAAAQSVSPPIAEYQERASSSFRLENASIFPITAVLEVRGFRITEQGEVVDVPLDTSRIHVKLSEMSFRIPPRGSRTVFYEATGDSLPAWFNILSALSGTRTESGLNVRVLLPHVVYLNQKQPLRKEEVAVRRFEFDRRTGKARVQLENLGPHLGRVYQLNVADGGAAESAGGFPLMPHSRRWVEVDWKNSTPPNRLVLRFARFTIDTLLAPVPASLAVDSGAVPPRP